MNGGDIVLMKMLVHYTSIIYGYIAIDTTKTFMEITIGLEFQLGDSWLPLPSIRMPVSSTLSPKSA